MPANLLQGNGSLTHPTGDSEVSRASLEYMEQTNFLPLPGMEPLFLGIPACSLVIIPTESNWLPNRFVSTINQSEYHARLQRNRVEVMCFRVEEGFLLFRKKYLKHLPLPQQTELSSVSAGASFWYEWVTQKVCLKVQ